MYVYLVIAITFAGHAKPYGVYSDINTAMQGQEDCASLVEPSWHDFVHGDFGSLMRADRCEISRMLVNQPPLVPDLSVPPGTILPLD